MPELPEVETVRRGLAPFMEGVRIERVVLRRDGLRFPFPDRFAGRVSGREVVRLGRRAKYLLADLAPARRRPAETLILHLGMSGKFTATPAATSVSSEPHEHVVFELEGGARVGYADPRRFGFMDLIETEQLATSRHIANLGVEPLGNGLNADYLRARWAGKRTPLKSALLDQRVVAGLGNIYVCEALFRAGLSPRRQAGNVSARQAEALVGAIRAVLRDAIAAGGTSLRDYAHTDGSLGYFQHRFQVYGREGEACVTCEAPVRRFQQGGRSTFYCGRCQR